VAEDYKAVEQLVPTLAAEIVWEMIDDLGWDAGRLDFLLPPQLSGRMTARIVEGLGLPGAKEISCVADTGNTGNALPFFQLERLADVIAPGQRALAAAVESSKWIKAGFALEAV
jgi:3-oxoacyl-[acyl-carrier-protein] synthase-3